MCRSIGLEVSRRIRGGSVMWGFLRGRDIRITLGRLLFSSVRIMHSLPLWEYCQLRTSDSYLHDRGLPSGLPLRQRLGLRRPLRHHRRPFLPHPLADVCLRSPTPRTSRREETLREWQPLGVVLALRPKNKHLDSLPSPAL